MFFVSRNDGDDTYLLMSANIVRTYFPKFCRIIDGSASAYVILISHYRCDWQNTNSNSKESVSINSEWNSKTYIINMECFWVYYFHQNIPITELFWYIECFEILVKIRKKRKMFKNFFFEQTFLQTFVEFYVFSQFRHNLNVKFKLAL